VKRRSTHSISSSLICFRISLAVFAMFRSLSAWPPSDERPGPVIRV
jgi:hypothetical protein